MSAFDQLSSVLCPGSLVLPALARAAQETTLEAEELETLGGGLCILHTCTHFGQLFSPVDKYKTKY